jgi:F0F1-type ATP synthase gamma subunit
MEMVSATKLKKALDRVEHARPYFKQMDEVFSHLTASIQPDEKRVIHPLMRIPGEEGNILLAVIGSDKGLCGSFNTNILREAWKFINKELSEPLKKKFDPAPGDIEITLVTPSNESLIFKGPLDSRSVLRTSSGQDPTLDIPGLYRGQITYKPSDGGENRFELNINITEDTSGTTIRRFWSTDPGIYFPYMGTLKLTRVINAINVTGKSIYILPVGKKINDVFERVKNPRVRLIEPEINFNQTMPLGELNRFSRHLNDLFVTGAVGRVYLVYMEYMNSVRQVPRLEPYLPLGFEMKVDSKQVERDYIFEPSSESLFMNLIPAYARIKIFRAMAHSFTSEHSIRMNTMRNATDNASELIDTLTLQRNKARQAAITKELSEIVGGAEALKG